MKINFIAIFCMCMLLFLIAACTEEQPKRPETELFKPAPSLNPEVILRPSLPTVEGIIAAEVKNATGTNIEVQWFVNDEISSQENTFIFKPDKLNKGDIVQAKVIYNGKDYFSNKVIIANTMPVIKDVKILPDRPKCNDSLRVDINAMDRDRDEIFYDYKWFVNGKLKGEESYLDGPFKRDDQVTVEVTPSDTEEYGKPVTAKTVIVNSPPSIDSVIQNESFENDLFQAKVSTTDLDNDTLIYSVEKGPEGLEIDPSGLITWKAGSEKAGEHDFIVIVEDGHGARVRMPVSLEIGY